MIIDGKKLKQIFNNYFLPLNTMIPSLVIRSTYKTQYSLQLLLCGNQLYIYTCLLRNEVMDIDWYQCDYSSINLEIQEKLASLEAVVVLCANINAYDSLNWDYKNISTY